VPSLCPLLLRLWLIDRRLRAGYSYCTCHEPLNNLKHTTGRTHSTGRSWCIRRYALLSWSSLCGSRICNTRAAYTQHRPTTTLQDYSFSKAARFTNQIEYNRFDDKNDSIIFVIIHPPGGIVIRRV